MTFVTSMRRCEIIFSYSGQPIHIHTYLTISSQSPQSPLGNRGRDPLVAAKQAPEPPNTRLSVGDYIADILLDARPDGTIYHWIVQRVGSAAIIHWGQEYTFEDAYSTVSTCLADLNDTDKKKA
jgi:hypothetical protein